MKLTLSFIFSFMIPLSFATEEYHPDENHLPPDEIQKQQERQEQQEKRLKKKKRTELPNFIDERAIDDPRYDKLDEEYRRDKDGSY